MASTQGQDLLSIRVTTRASSNFIKDELLADGSRLLRVYVTAVPENGKANDAVIELLAKELKIRKSAFTIISGHSSRNKKIKIQL